MIGFLTYQKMKEMLKHVIKLLLLVLSILLISCKKELTVQQQKDELIKKRNLYFSYSKKLIGDKQYYTIYKKANDTIVNWVSNNLKGYQWKTYPLDSLLCFNSEKNKFFGAILRRCEEEGCVQDYIVNFYGAKVKGQWYYFRGPLLVLPREYYQENIHKPLSLALMKQIAIEEIFSGYLIEIPSNNTSNSVKYKINNREFIDMEARNRDGTFGQYSKTFEDEVLRAVNDNWKEKIDSQ